MPVTMAAAYMDRSKGCEPRPLWNVIGATLVKIADLLDSKTD